MMCDSDADSDARHLQGRSRSSWANCRKQVVLHDRRPWKHWISYKQYKRAAEARKSLCCSRIGQMQVKARTAGKHSEMQLSMFLFSRAHCDAESCLSALVWSFAPLSFLPSTDAAVSFTIICAVIAMFHTVMSIARSLPLFARSSFLLSPFAQTARLECSHAGPQPWQPIFSKHLVLHELLLVL